MDRGCLYPRLCCHATDDWQVFGTLFNLTGTVVAFVLLGIVLVLVELASSIMTEFEASRSPALLATVMAGWL